MEKMFTASAWYKSKRGRTLPVLVGVARVSDGVAVRIETEGLEVTHTLPDVPDAQLFVLRTTNSQNLAEWVALALPEAVSV